MKEHILANMINQLTETAKKHGDKQCLRELIHRVVFTSFEEDRRWEETHPNDKPKEYL